MLNLKCGIHNGLVLFGLIETSNRKQITIIGRDVNIASRLVNKIAQNDEIIISKTLKKMLGEKIVSKSINVNERLRQKKDAEQKKDGEDIIKSFEDIDEVFSVIEKPVSS